jgi:hypothetical protein
MDGRRVLDDTTDNVLRGEYSELIVGSRHENQDEISHGHGSTRVRLRRGYSHFWVIRCHKFNGAVYFLI